MASQGRNPHWAGHGHGRQGTWHSKGLGKSVESGAPGDLPGCDVGQHKTQLVQQVPQLAGERGEAVGHAQMGTPSPGSQAGSKPISVLPLPMGSEPQWVLTVPLSHYSGVPHHPSHRPAQRRGCPGKRGHRGAPCCPVSEGQGTVTGPPVGQANTCPWSNSPASRQGTSSWAQIQHALNPQVADWALHGPPSTARAVPEPSSAWLDPSSITESRGDPGVGPEPSALFGRHSSPPEEHPHFNKQGPEH